MTGDEAMAMAPNENNNNNKAEEKEGDSELRYSSARTPSAGDCGLDASAVERGPYDRSTYTISLISTVTPPA